MYGQKVWIWIIVELFWNYCGICLQALVDMFHMKIILCKDDSHFFMTWIKLIKLLISCLLSVSCSMKVHDLYLQEV